MKPIDEKSEVSGLVSHGVKVTFKLPDGGLEVKNFRPGEANVPMSPQQGLSDSLESLDGSNDTNDCSHQGKSHDHGPLLPPRGQGGVYAQLIECVIATKEYSNSYLTHVIKKEASQNVGKCIDQEQSERKKHKPS